MWNGPSRMRAIPLTTMRAFPGNVTAAACALDAQRFFVAAGVPAGTRSGVEPATAEMGVGFFGCFGFLTSRLPPYLTLLPWNCSSCLRARRMDRASGQCALFSRPCRETSGIGLTTAGEQPRTVRLEVFKKSIAVHHVPFPWRYLVVLSLP